MSEIIESSQNGNGLTVAYVIDDGQQFVVCLRKGIHRYNETKEVFLNKEQALLYYSRLRKENGLDINKAKLRYEYPNKASKWCPMNVRF